MSSWLFEMADELLHGFEESLLLVPRETLEVRVEPG